MSIPTTHTSLDNLNFIKAEYIQHTLQLYLKLIDKLEEVPSKQLSTPDKNIISRSTNDLIYRNLYPNCEVMLSKHDLYPKTGGELLPGLNTQAELDRILWLLFYCDGDTSLNEIAEKTSYPLYELNKTIRVLEGKAILKRVGQ
jgi:aminopeptidase-like protein